MLFISLILLILSNAVAARKNSAIQYSRSTIFSHTYSALSIYFIVDWYYLGNSISLYNGLLYCSLHNLIFIFFLFTLGFFILFLTSFFPTNTYEETSTQVQTIKSEENKNNVATHLDKILQSLHIRDILQSRREHYLIIEYPLITVFILLGGITLLSSNDLVTMFLAIELQSYGLYILSTIYRNSESSTSAGLTYFLLGGLSSCIILLGQSLLYINLGNTNLDGIYIIHSIFNNDPNLLTFFLVEAMPQGINEYYLPYSPLITVNFYQYSIQVAFIVLSIGFLFKISAAPFHSWSPGVYDAIPTVTTTFVAIIAKISILILLFDLVYSTGWTTLDYSWKNVLLFSSFLSLIIGSILGLSQFRIKRLYAYSTISHVGFILLALCVQSVESIQAFFFYILQYSLSNLNAFIILVAIGYTSVYYIKDNKDALLNKENDKEFKEQASECIKEYKSKMAILSPIEYIDQLKGYFYLNPIMAISLSITLYSFVGIPPLVGFFAKQMILSSALDNGYIFMCLIAILTSVISAVYYLYIIKDMFFEKSKYKINSILRSLINFKFTNYGVLEGEARVQCNTLSSSLTCVISVLSLLILMFIFLYHETYFLLNIMSIIVIY